MSIIYNGEYSIVFTDTTSYPISSKNTWTDFRLVPQSKCSVVPAEATINLSQIPGSSSYIDVTEKLANKVLYSRRVGSWKFILDTDRLNKDGVSINTALSDLKNYFNGRKLYCEPQVSTSNRSYRGRVWIKDIQTTSTYPEVEIDYDLDYEYLNVSVSRDSIEMYTFDVLCWNGDYNLYFPQGDTNEFIENYCPAFVCHYLSETHCNEFSVLRTNLSYYVVDEGYVNTYYTLPTIDFGFINMFPQNYFCETSSGSGTIRMELKSVRDFSSTYNDPKRYLFCTVMAFPRNEVIAR